MNITTIQVTAGRTFNHPHEDYSNLRPAVTMVASLQPGDDAAACAKQLQAQAEGLVEDHKRGLLQSIEELYQLTTKQAEVRGLQREIERAQERLNQMRRETPGLKLIGDAEERDHGPQTTDHRQ